MPPELQAGDALQPTGHQEGGRLPAAGAELKRGFKGIKRPRTELGGSFRLFRATSRMRCLIFALFLVVLDASGWF